MGKLKCFVILLAIVSLVIAVPAKAQFFDGPQFPGAQQFPDDFMGMGGRQSMPFMPPFMGMGGRQSEWVMPITQLPASPGNGKSLMATMEGISDISMFTAAIKASGYGENLDSGRNYLVFAPSDKAIMRDLSVKDIESLVSDPGLVKGLVENCVVSLKSGRPQNSEKTFTALSGKPIMVLRSKAGVTANGADVLKYIGADNGKLIVTDGAVGT